MLLKNCILIFVFLLISHSGKSQFVETDYNLKSSKVNFSSNLPIVLINTSGKRIMDEPKITATMQIVYNGVGETNDISDKVYDYNGYIGIELRGNSTQNFEKKPYGVETRDEAGNNLNVEILGMPAENDWVFRASYLDRSFIRNPLAHHLSAETGQWSSKFRFCELFLNDEYQGIYIIMEKIKRDKNRLNISTLTPDENDEPDITGGYIYEITGFHNDFGENRRIKYPKKEDISPQQLNYIQEYDDNFRQFMFLPDWSKRNEVFNEWIDVHSFINEMIVQETMRNSDAYGWSAYFHKDKGGPLKAGPVWDFDQAGGNSTYNDGFETTGWVFDTYAFPNPEFWPQLYNDKVYKYLMKLKWQRYRKGPFSDNAVEHFIDSIANLLSEAQQRNFNKWEILGTQMWRDTPGWENRFIYDHYVEYLKYYMFDRMSWIDEQMKNVPVAVEFPVYNPFTYQLEFNVFPNPVKDILYISLYNTEGSYTIILSDISGRSLQKLTIDGEDEYLLGLNVEKYKAGVYFLDLFQNGTNIRTQKIIKTK